MALNKAVLQTSIRQAFADAKSNENDPEGAFDDLARKISDAVDLFVKSGTVTGTTASSCTTGGAVGTCVGTIS